MGEAGTAALFEVSVGLEEATAAGSPGSSAVGKAAEHEAIGILLRRGHKVATPVIDDDGVDLIVDYGTLVQVKVTGQRNHDGYPHVQLKRNSYRRRADGARQARPERCLAEHIDVLLVLVKGIGWYVMPRAAVSASGVVFGPRMEQWRDGWSVFGA